MIAPSLLDMIDAYEPSAVVPIAVYHPTGACTEPEGGCQARLKATCCVCDTERVLCTVTRDEMRAIMRSVWACGESCSGD